MSTDHTHGGQWVEGTLGGVGEDLYADPGPGLRDRPLLVRSVVFALVAAALTLLSSWYEARLAVSSAAQSGPWVLGLLTLLVFGRSGSITSNGGTPIGATLGGATEFSSASESAAISRLPGQFSVARSIAWAVVAMGLSLVWAVALRSSLGLDGSDAASWRWFAVPCIAGAAGGWLGSFAGWWGSALVLGAVLASPLVVTLDPGGSPHRSMSHATGPDIPVDERFSAESSLTPAIVRVEGPSEAVWIRYAGCPPLMLQSFLTPGTTVERRVLLPIPTPNGARAGTSGTGLDERREGGRESGAGRAPHGTMPTVSLVAGTPATGDSEVQNIEVLEVGPPARHARGGAVIRGLPSARGLALGLALPPAVAGEQAGSFNLGRRGLYRMLVALVASFLVAWAGASPGLSSRWDAALAAAVWAGGATLVLSSSLMSARSIAVDDEGAGAWAGRDLSGVTLSGVTLGGVTLIEGSRSAAGTQWSRVVRRVAPARVFPQPGRPPEIEFVRPASGQARVLAVEANIYDGSAAADERDGVLLGVEVDLGARRDSGSDTVIDSVEAPFDMGFRLLDPLINTAATLDPCWVRRPGGRIEALGRWEVGGPRPEPLADQSAAPPAWLFAGIPLEREATAGLIEPESTLASPGAWHATGAQRRDFGSVLAPGSQMPAWIRITADQ